MRGELPYGTQAFPLADTMVEQAWTVERGAFGDIHVLPCEGDTIARGHVVSLNCPACQPRPLRDGPLDEPVWSHVEPTWPGALVSFGMPS